MVTSGAFTAEAKSFAQGRNITLIDGKALDKLIQSARTGLAPQGPSEAAAPAAEQAPACPKCSAAMVKREAKRGANAGQQFWGCTNYPGCRGTVPIGK